VGKGGMRMMKIIYNQLTCFTCGESLEEKGVIVRERTALSGKIKAFCPVCCKYFAGGEVFEIIMEWTK